MIVPSACGAAQVMQGESIVLAGETPARLLAKEIDPRSVIVRATYLPGGQVFEAGRDYTFDAATSSIARTAGSRIPDFSASILFGQKDFDHSRFPGFGNGPFLVYVDYTHRDALKLTTPVDARPLLKKVVAKLDAGEEVKVIAFGDSITAGGDATSPELQYPARFADHLQKRYPKARITLENGATGGDTTVNGLARLDEKVISRKPDLVLVAFGMNDHNLPAGGGVGVEDFRKNLETIVQRIRKATDAEVILLSTFPPNADWHFSTNQMEKYARATQEAAQNCAVAYVDIYTLWQKVLGRKDVSSLLGNNINHPTDFGHWLYLQALQALEF